VWEIASVQCVQTLEGHTGVVMDLLCWDSFLLSCSLDGTVKASVEAMAPCSRVWGGSLCIVFSGSRAGKRGVVGGVRGREGEVVARVAGGKARGWR
jgi:hypothetical protein